MSLYVLDTDILSLYQLGNAAVCQQVAEHTTEELAVTIISVEEQLSSWYTLLRKKKTRAELATVYERFTNSIRFLSRLPVLTFTEAAMETFEELKKMKLGVKAMDLRIAAIALEHDAIVVTRNRRDFECVPDLEIEDWSA